MIDPAALALSILAPLVRIAQAWLELLERRRERCRRLAAKRDYLPDSDPTP